MNIKVMKNIMDANQEIAKSNNETFTKKNITAINVMASPGAGKTSVILKLIEMISPGKKMYVIEGDIASSIDAQKIDKLNIPVIQINTGGGCHLDANMIKSSISDMNLEENSILLIENVGNLVCPSAFYLGETLKLIIASVPEGHDKPYKYIPMFESADVIILNKIDLTPYIDFDYEVFKKGVLAINTKAPIFKVSCKTNERLNELSNFILDSHIS